MTATMVTGAAAVTGAVTPTVDRHFAHLAEAVRTFFAETVADAPHLFETDTVDLYAVYLNALPADGRQGHRCECCRRFMNTWGSLVTIRPDGRSVPVFWPVDTNAVPAYYAPAIAAVWSVVAQARVARPYFSDARRWGTAKNVDRATGHTWHHFAVEPPARFVTEQKRSKTTDEEIRTNAAVAAQKVTDFKVLRRSVLDYPTALVAQAMALVSTPGFPEGNKLIERARWFLHVRQRVDGMDQASRDNILMDVVVAAPAGWATPRSTIFGTVLDDLKAGTPVDEIKRKFAAKTDPRVFQRAQAAPTAGNLAQAEKLVADLGVGSALVRRFAGPDDLRYLWTPKPPAPEKQAGTGTVFGHLYRRAKGAEPAAPAPLRDNAFTPITFSRLRRTVLPVAESIQVYVSPTPKNYVGFAAAMDPEAAPILRWDSAAPGRQRNTVGAYSYGGRVGSPPSSWGLPTNTWQTVSGITLFPWMWDDEDALPAFPRGAVFIIPTLRDKNPTQLDLFAECLIGDLHSVRSSIEALAKNGLLADCPTLAPDGQPWRIGGISLGCGGVNLRVRQNGVESHYSVTMWD